MYTVRAMSYVRCATRCRTSDLRCRVGRRMTSYVMNDILGAKESRWHWHIPNLKIGFQMRTFSTYLEKYLSSGAGPPCVMVGPVRSRVTARPGCPGQRRGRGAAAHPGYWWSNPLQLFSMVNGDHGERSETEIRTETSPYVPEPT